MLDVEQVETLAQSLLDAHVANAPYRRLTDELDGSASLEDAYRVQRRLQALLLEQSEVGAIVGWKVALTSRAMQDFVGVDEPLAGCIFASRVHPAPARLSLGQFQLVNARTRLQVDGEPVGEGRGGDALGHPLEALAWLANLFARRGEALPAGALVMTGSSITTRFPTPGQHFMFEVEGLGQVETRFEP